MTEESETAAREALAGNGAFERSDERFVVTTTPFDATVRVEASDGMARHVVVVEVPTIDAAVDGERVADVVGEGWYETFERRIAAVGDVTRAEPEPPTVERVDPETVRVTFAYHSPDPRSGAADAKALVDYVEGTWIQGVIPGYDYREPVRGLLDRAGDRSDGRGRPKL